MIPANVGQTPSSAPDPWSGSAFPSAPEADVGVGRSPGGLPHTAGPHRIGTTRDDKRMNCDRIARWYRWLERIAFGRALEHRRSAFLGQVGNARRILVLGDGDGRALERLLAAAPNATCDYVDCSKAMLALARERAGAERVTYYNSDALTVNLAHREYDLIVTHFFLDCLNATDAAGLIARVTAAAQPDARWLVSEFRQGSPWSAFVVRALYFFFRIATGLDTTEVPDYASLLGRHGFRVEREETAWRGLLVSELWVRTARP